MRMRGRSSITLVLALGTIAFLSLGLTAVLQGFEAGDGATLGLRAARLGEDVAGGVLASRAGLLRVGPGGQDRVTELAEDLDPSELDAIQRGAFLVLDGRQALSWARTGRRALGRAIVIVNPPEVFDGVPAVARGRLIAAITGAAARLGATLMVDCTDADLARLTPEGITSLAAVRGKVWRMVVFDGAHHLAGLGLAPELLLLPVTSVGGIQLANHGYVRDAVPWPDLSRVISDAGVRPAVLTIPRLSTPVKSKAPLGALAKGALRMLAHAARPEAVAAQRLGGWDRRGGLSGLRGGSYGRHGEDRRVRRAGRTRAVPVTVDGRLVRLGHGVALYSLSLRPDSGTSGQLRQVRRALASAHAREPIRRLWLGIGYGQVNPFTIGKVAGLRPIARSAAGAGREIPTPRGPVNIPVRVVGLPYAFWDLAELKVRGAIGGLLSRAYSPPTKMSAAIP